MSLVVDTATINSLITERTALFQHQFQVIGITLFWLLLICLIIFVWGYLSHRQHTNGESAMVRTWTLFKQDTIPGETGTGGARMLIGIMGAFMVVGVSLCVWADTYFEQKQFERAPQTYVIKHLR